VSTNSTTKVFPKNGKRAKDETRTRDPNLGKVVLYQLSYFRILSSSDKKWNANIEDFFNFAIPKIIEVESGFEPLYEVLQTSA
jgi:hypothetical protein